MRDESPEVYPQVLSQRFYVDASGLLCVEELVKAGPRPDFLPDLPGLEQFVVNRPVLPFLVYIEDERPL